jgi:hypothetical protein
MCHLERHAEVSSWLFLCNPFIESMKKIAYRWWIPYCNPPPSKQIQLDACRNHPQNQLDYYQLSLQLCCKIFEGAIKQHLVVDVSMCNHQSTMQQMLWIFTAYIVVFIDLELNQEGNIKIQRGSEGSVEEMQTWRPMPSSRDEDRGPYLHAGT